MEILAWIVFGLVVGVLAKVIHPGDDEPSGCLATICVGVVGSFVGGWINYFLGNHTFAPAGFLMSIVGAVVFLIFWKWWKKNA